MAGSQAPRRLELRHLETIPEFREAVRLQKEIWGFDDIELLPVRLFVVAKKVGGQAIGGFDGERMAGFLLAIPGLRQGVQYLHSHMMGVLREYRNSGLGRRLKLEQRREALSRGIELVEWTFDPLELKNAYFNIERLGAIVRRYVLNQYGTTTSSLHGGLPTDRCVAEWRLASERVRSVVDGNPVPRPEIVERIPVPMNIGDLRHHAPDQAREIQKRVSEQFVAALDRGLAAVGFETAGGFGTYLIGPWDSK